MQFWIDILLLICVLLTILVVILVLRNIKIKKQGELYRMIDEETGIGNYQMFKRYFEHTVDDATRELYHIAYIVIDVSYLRFYHEGSSLDNILKYTAYVLSEFTFGNEISARITENGFAYAFRTTNEDEVKKRIQELMGKLNGFDNTARKNKAVFHCAVYHVSQEDKNCELLIFNLRKNCNRIIGTTKQVIYCDAHSMNKIFEEKKAAEDILRGLNNNEFKMYLQFIVDRNKKNIVSAEALSRWYIPEKGVTGPGMYIENMETTGLISKHDFYMFEQVCKQLEKWNNTKYGDISISCNFTRLTLSEEDFIDKLKNIYCNYNFDRSKLGIEITEDVMEKDLEVATNNVRLCREIGFMIYLDDLGSGYTALTNLCDYPIDVVKLDRDILLKTNISKGRNLFDGIIALAHSLNIDVICEGVETEAQNKLVSFSECDYIQGWYYSKPINSEESEAFIDNYILVGSNNK